MTELAVIKTPTGALAPADQQTADFVAKLKLGQGLHADFKRVRDIVKHRRGFALLQFAFEMWDAPQLEYEGQPVAKNFDRFRKDVTILAGHYTSTVNLRGEIRLEAKSLSFGSMDDTEFAQVYKNILGVVWDRILKAKGYDNPEVVDAIVDRLLRFE